MSPLIRDGAAVIVSDRPPAVGDVVVFRSASSELPLIKRVAAVGGQFLSIVGGRIVVDGVVVTTSDGRPYSLSRERLAVLSLYVGTMPASALLVLGEDPAGTTDSSLLGLIDASAIVGVATTMDA